VRGTGDSRTPLLSLIVSTVLILIFTPALILGWLGLPRLGVASAAYANVVANTLALIYMLVSLRLEKNPLALDMSIVRNMKLEVGLLGQLVRIGIPTGLQMVMVSLAEIAVISLVNRFGSSATAAYGAVNQIVSYVQFPAISIGIASSIFGAQSIGARKFDRLRKIARAGITLNWVIGAVLIGLVYAFDNAAF
jgi:Na+-driven multidrug efflux pump